MLAATQRLRRSTDFAAAVRAGRRVGRGSLVVHLNSPEAPTVPDQVEDRSAEPASTGSTCLPARAGFVVSKAVGGAVLRNRVRRRLRHLVRERLPQLPAGSTLVVRALPAAATAGYERLAVDLDAALTAARAPRPARNRRDGTDRR